MEESLCWLLECEQQKQKKYSTLEEGKTEKTRRLQHQNSRQIFQSCSRGKNTNKTWLRHAIPLQRKTNKETPPLPCLAHAVDLTNGQKKKKNSTETGTKSYLCVNECPLTWPEPGLHPKRSNKFLTKPPWRNKELCATKSGPKSIAKISKNSQTEGD